MSQSGILSSIGRYLLKKRNKKSTPDGLVNYNDSRTIGILYSTDDKDLSDMVEGFISDLKSDGKQVYVMGYTFNKDTEEKNVNVFKQCISKKDLNLFNIPKHNSILDFIDIEFDIIVNLAEDSNLPLNYICSISKAKLKVAGYTDVYTYIYDLMIDFEGIEDNSGKISAITRYLKMINNKIK